MTPALDDEQALRQQLTQPANNTQQLLYVSEDLNTGRAMVKDEDVCLHCGLCAERCPTSAWDLQKFLYNVTKATDLGDGNQANSAGEVG